MSSRIDAQAPLADKLAVRVEISADGVVIRHRNFDSVAVDNGYRDAVFFGERIQNNFFGNFPWHAHLMLKIKP